MHKPLKPHEIDDLEHRFRLMLKDQNLDKTGKGSDIWVVNQDEVIQVKIERRKV